MADTNIYQAVIEDLEAKITALQATLDNLKSISGMASGIGSLPTSKASNQGPQSANFGHDAFFGMTIPDAAKKYLAAVKKTVSIPILSDALLAGGLKSTATNMKENVRSILGRNTDFVRINGEFGLAEWYPSRKGLPKKRGGLHAVDLEEEVSSSETEMPSVETSDGILES